MNKLIVILAVLLSLTAQANEVNDEPRKCKIKESTDEQFINGMRLRHVMAATLKNIVNIEKAKGNDPKVFIIGRAGQNMSGVLTLKNKLNGRDITLSDIMSDPDIRYAGNTESGSNSYSAEQYAIKRKYADKDRQLIYSHIGFVFINHPLVENPVIVEDSKIVRRATNEDLETHARQSKMTFEELQASGEKKIKILGGGEFWIEELLKPCADDVPHHWYTGLSMFYQDDPHEYKSIVMVPTQKLQDRIYDLVIKKERQADFLGQIYNAATGWTNKVEQNSNQFVLEIIAAAMQPDPSVIRNRLDTFAFLKKTGYRPTTLIADSFKASFMTGGLFMPRHFKVSPDENPYARTHNITDIVTELSIREYLIKNKAITGLYEAKLPDEFTVKAPKVNNNYDAGGPRH